MDFQRFQRGVAWVLLAMMIGLFGWAIWGTLNPPRIAGVEMRDALAGNTVIGHWDGEPYAQYFDPSGETIVAAGAGEPGSGRWWVEEPHRLCFEVPEWDLQRCEELWQDGDSLMRFEEGTGRAHPATRVRGRLVVDPEPDQVPGGG